MYHPLVVNQGSQPGRDFIPPVIPFVPRDAVVALWFGTNADTLTLSGATQTCVNGLGNSIFGQFAYCNAPYFFSEAFNAVSRGLLRIVPPGIATAAKGQSCPSGSRDFRIVDMDQSDNVGTTYLLINGTVLAQNTPHTNSQNANAEELTNGSDNVLVNSFIQPVMGCETPMVPSLTAPSGNSPALFLNVRNPAKSSASV